MNQANGSMKRSKISLEVAALILDLLKLTESIPDGMDTPNQHRLQELHTVPLYSSSRF